MRRTALTRLRRALGTWNSAWIVALLCAATVGTLQADDYPTRPVRFIVGPGPDVLARLLAQGISDALGKQFYVEPLPAAGGIVAGQTAAKAPPDGHTLLLTTGSYSIMQAINPKLPFNLLRDFEPVVLLGELGFVLVAAPDFPASSVAELLQRAQAMPGTINCASSGRGTTAHLGCEMLRHFGKVDIVHVPYNGAGPALNDLLGRQVQIMFVTLPQGTEYVASGRLRALAVTGSQRAPAIPEVPTIAEAGLPKASFSSWNGIHTSAGTPPAVVQTLNREFSKLLDIADVKQRMTALGLEARGGSREDFDRFVKNDVARWADVVKEIGLKVE